MAWRLVEIPAAEATGEDLTDGELIGVSISLCAHCSPMPDVYHRAHKKIRLSVDKAIDNEMVAPALDYLANGGASPNDVQTLKTGASQTHNRETR